MNLNNQESWKRSHGNHSSNKFSNLEMINTNNVKDLDIAWTYTFEKKGDIPGNPIYFNGVVYLSSTEKSLVALNAANGEKIWEHQTEGLAARRGLIINEEEKSKIYFCDQKNLISLYASNGQTVKNFGKKGKIKLKKKCQITPVIIDDKIIPDDSELTDDTKLALKTLLWDKLSNSGMADTKEFQDAVSDWAQLLNQPIPNIKRLSLDIEVESEIGRIPDPKIAAFAGPPVLCPVKDTAKSTKNLPTPERIRIPPNIINSTM